jgi:hypothetical protein
LGKRRRRRRRRMRKILGRFFDVVYVLQVHELSRFSAQLSMSLTIQGVYW